MYFANGEELLVLCDAHHCPISAVMRNMEAERSGNPEEAVNAEMEKTLQIMRNSVHEPLDHPQACIGGLIGGESSRLKARLEAGQSFCGKLISKAVIYSLGVLEQNSSMRLIVAAPTAGSSGVVPGVLFSLQEEHMLGDEVLLNGLFCAGAIGYLFMRNASVAGAEAGCQAEVGAASAMAAGAVTEMMGGTPKQCLDAASIAVANLLGLVCDPVAGLVQVPCQSRNALGAANALICAEMALGGVAALIPFDEMLEALLKVGRNMPCELRETALGGCAATPTGRAWMQKIFE